MEYNSYCNGGDGREYGWITRTFRTKDAQPMIKSFVLSRLEYCYILTIPVKAGKNMAEMENIQWTFTAQNQSSTSITGSALSP